MSPFLRGMTGQQMGVGRRSLAQMLAPATAPTPTTAGPTMAAAQPLDIAGLRRQVLAQSAAPTAPQSRQALMAKYGLAPTAPAQKPSPMQRLSSAMPASGTPQMAGLGAAGRAMLELSGYQPAAQAPSIGQILARSAEAGIGAIKEQRAEEQARAQAEAQAQAAAEQQAYEREQAEKEFELKQERLAFDKQKEMAGKPLKPTSGTDIVEVDGVFYEEKFAQFPIGTKGTDSLGRIYSGVRKPIDKPSQSKTGYGFEAVKDGKWVGRVVEKDGVMYVRDSEGNETPVTDDMDVLETDTYKQGISKKKDFDTNLAELQNQLRSRTKLEEYRKSRQCSREGVGLLADQFSTTMKTVFSEVLPKKYSKLTPSELSAAIAEGQLNGQIGSLRLQVVGGGVMTEQDALRVISYLGGNLSALTSKAAVENAIQRVLSEKDGLIEDLAEKHNKQVDYFYGRGGQHEKVEFTPFSREFATSQRLDDDPESGEQPSVDINIAPEGFDPVGWSLLSDEDKKAYLGIGQ